MLFTGPLCAACLLALAAFADLFSHNYGDAAAEFVGCIGMLVIAILSFIAYKAKLNY